jgi:ribosomal protein L37AE/L43A
MPWDDQDDLAFILSESEEEKTQRVAAAADPRNASARSRADDILDAVSGQEVKTRDKTLCPQCGAKTVKRGPGVGLGVKTRKCRKCGLEFPVGMVQSRSAPVGPVVSAPGVGPYFGEGGPPMDVNQPVQRRIAEHIRRVKDNE